MGSTGYDDNHCGSAPSRAEPKEAARSRRLHPIAQQRGERSVASQHRPSPPPAIGIDAGADTDHTGPPTARDRVVRLVGHNKRVLDLGAATGSLAAALVERGCTVVGIERDPDLAVLAKPHCEAVLVTDLSSTDFGELADAPLFDVIVAADVLEHLVEPARVLEKVLRYLAPDGYLVTSIPNVAHGSVRLALLAGQFPYAETGTLEPTNVRFYTLESMIDMLIAGGVTPLYVEPVEQDPERGEVLEKVALSDLPDSARAAVRADPAAAVHQYIVASVVGRPDEGLAGALLRQSRQLESALEALRRPTGATGPNDALLELHSELLQLRDLDVHARVREQADTLRIALLEAQVDRLAELEIEHRHETNVTLAQAQAEFAARDRELEWLRRSRVWRAAVLSRRLAKRARGRG
jgi:2-polyprenyl-3-methyl-5-hydroxy-6-metoxy-1,4-benzoquinol methylase